MTDSVPSVCEGRLQGSVPDFILHCQWDCPSIYPFSFVYLGLGSRGKKPKQQSPDLPLKTPKFKDSEVWTNTLVLSTYICLWPSILCFWLCLSLVIQVYFRLFGFLQHFPFYLVLCVLSPCLCVSLCVTLPCPVSLCRTLTCSHVLPSVFHPLSPRSVVRFHVCLSPY